MQKKLLTLQAVILLLMIALCGCEKNTLSYGDVRELIYGGNTLQDIPVYTGEDRTVLNGGVPYFTLKNAQYEEMEYYSPLDSLGRTGVCFAIIGPASMPQEEREGIGMIKPSGWQTVRYDDVVEGKYLYNRCHIIGYQLTGENANEKNLMTGTRHFNVEGMLPVENAVSSYVKKTQNHVLYRVSPVFDGKDLLAKGVIIEALSVEDSGEGIMINVFVHNIQPGIEIDYSDADSSLKE